MSVLTRMERHRQHCRRLYNAQTLHLPAYLSCLPRHRRRRRPHRWRWRQDGCCCSCCFVFRRRTADTSASQWVNVPGSRSIVVGFCLVRAVARLFTSPSRVLVNKWWWWWWWWAVPDMVSSSSTSGLRLTGCLYSWIGTGGVRNFSLANTSSGWLALCALELVTLCCRHRFLVQLIITDVLLLSCKKCRSYCCVHECACLSLLHHADGVFVLYSVSWKKGLGWITTISVNLFKPNDVKWLHFRVFRVILV